MSAVPAPLFAPTAEEVLLEFTVLGDAQPAGSKRGFKHPTTGAVILTDANKNSKPWQREVKTEAIAATPVGFELLTEPLALDVTFHKPRPRSHYRTGRHSGFLRDSAPPWPATRPDCTKLLRGLEDALTGVIWRDDAQVVTQTARKRYGTPARVEVRICKPTPGVAE